MNEAKSSKVFRIEISFKDERNYLANRPMVYAVKNFDDACYGYKALDSELKRLDSLKMATVMGGVFKDANQGIHPALFHKFQSVLRSEEIARVSLQAFLDADSSKQSDNGTFEDRESLWVQHYRAAEVYSDGLPAMLDNCLQIWSQAQAHERGLGGPDAFLGAQNLRSPLHICSALGFEGLGEVYLQMGKDPNVLAYPDGQTALHLAAAGAHLGMMELLLDRGADIEKTTLLTGKTALQIAASQGHADTVQLLCDAGADTEATDNLGHTALELATQNGHQKVAELLIGHGRGRASWTARGRHGANNYDGSRPAMWRCCQCGEHSQPEKTPVQCVFCGHRNCVSCGHKERPKPGSSCDNCSGDGEKWFWKCCQCDDGPNCCQCDYGPDRRDCDGKAKSNEFGDGWVAVDRPTCAKCYYCRQDCRQE